MFRPLLISLFLTSTAHADTWTVDDDGKADFDNIQAAVDASSDGDEIIVMPGTYTDFQPTQVVNMLGKAIILRSSNPNNPKVVASTIIDGEGVRRGISCENGESPKTIIKGITITHGFAYEGGGVYCNESSPSFEYCVFDSNIASSYGGGIYGSREGNLTVNNCVFNNNEASFGGGFYNSYNSSATISNCAFTYNAADYNGGGIYGDFNSNTSYVVSDCTFENNTANYGGAIYSGSGNPALSSCVFTGNSAASEGGGAFFYDLVTLTDCIFTDNFAGDDGGGIYVENERPEFTSVLLCGNTPDQIYGGWTDGGNNCVSFSCADSDNDGWPDKCNSIGDGIHLVPEEFSTIQAAIEAAGTGDEILVGPGTYLGTEDSVIDLGGKQLWIHSSKGASVSIINGENVRRGIKCTSGETQNTVIEGFTIRNGRGGDGGGILCVGSSPLIKDCLIIDNYANNRGGGICCINSSPILNACVIRDNYESGSYWDGGGLYSIHTYLLGGGISVGERPLLIDTIICGNAPDQVYGGWIDGGNSCVSFNCVDSDGDGRPDECDSVGDGIHMVPEEYQTIQDAIEAAGNGDEVLIAPGTYTGAGVAVIDLDGKRLWVHSSGGPDVTVIDGENDRLGIMCTSGENNESIIDGVTITRGQINYASMLGGGMLCQYSDPTILNCIFYQNHCANFWGAGWGGGIRIVNGSPSVAFCLFEDNYAESGGGGIYAANSSPVITECTFNYNVADEGSGLSCQDSSIVMENCSFTNNVTNGSFSNGAVLSSGCDISIAESSFVNNSMDGNGGIELVESSIAVSNCLFVNESIGVYLKQRSEGNITNCEFRYNNVGIQSAGDFEFSITNCKVVDNLGYGIKFYSNATNLPILFSSLVCNNIEGQIYGDYINGGGNIVADECPPDCPDINNDGYVNVSDLLAVIDQWGLTNSPADINTDGIVDVSDLLIVVGNWGPCE